MEEVGIIQIWNREMFRMKVDEFKDSRKGKVKGPRASGHWKGGGILSERLKKFWEERK